MDPPRLAADVAAVLPSRGRKSSTFQAGRHESVSVCMCDGEREKARDKHM